MVNRKTSYLISQGLLPSLNGKVTYMKDWTKTTFAERVHWARNRVTPKITQEKLAEYVKTSRVTITNWEAGKHGAEGRNLELAAEALDVDVIWLDTGEGNPGNFIPRIPDDSLSNLPKLLIHYYNHADERGKDTILTLAKHQASLADPLAEIPEGPDTGKMERRLNPKDPGPKTYSQKKKPTKKK
ncbi:MAG: hypothetical protein DBP02_15235 [gamma proteobacterium symbiont of Ctena orbiculata]|nr:MAG: hypothetical protein DBP02_15235 [gamma proteobacterium symbiont of Ctena orbiculata]